MLWRSIITRDPTPPPSLTTIMPQHKKTKTLDNCWFICLGIRVGLLHAGAGLNDRNVFDSAGTRIPPAWGQTGKQTCGNSHTLWSHYIQHLIVSSHPTTPQRITFFLFFLSPYLALRYGMGVFFQRQRQEVLFPSLKTWNTDARQLRLAKRLPSFSNECDEYLWISNRQTVKTNKHLQNRSKHHEEAKTIQC